jgi:hypothetical protein
MTSVAESSIGRDLESYSLPRILFFRIGFEKRPQHVGGWEIQHKIGSNPKWAMMRPQVHSPPQGEANQNEFIMVAKNHGV